MPGARKSVQEKAQENSLRSEELRIAAVQNKIVSAVRAKPSLATATWEFLKDRGVTDSNFSQPEEHHVLSSTKAAQLRRKQSMRDLKEASRQEALAAATAADAEEPMDSRYLVVAHLTVPSLRIALTRLGGAVWSPGNLAHHARALGKQELLQMLEYATGIDTTTPVYPKWLCFKAWCEHLQVRPAKRGARAAATGLPPVWSDKGVYAVISIDVPGQKIKVKQRFTKEVATISASDVTKEFVLEEAHTPCDMEIQLNFSEEKAMLCAPGKSHGYKLSKVFASHFVDEEAHLKTPSPKKRRSEQKAVGSEELPDKRQRMAISGAASSAHGNPDAKAKAEGDKDSDAS